MYLLAFCFPSFENCLSFHLPFYLLDNICVCVVNFLSAFYRFPYNPAVSVLAIHLTYFFAVVIWYWCKHNSFIEWIWCCVFFPFYEILSRALMVVLVVFSSYWGLNKIFTQPCLSFLVFIIQLDLGDNFHLINWNFSFWHFWILFSVSLMNFSFLLLSFKYCCFLKKILLFTYMWMCVHVFVCMYAPE